MTTVPLIVGGSHNVSVNVLPKLLAAFKESHPSVQFVLETNNSPVIEKRLLASELEIALITNPSHRAEITYEPYEEMEVVAFCLPTNPLAQKKRSLKELVECPLVLRSGGRTERMFTNLGYKNIIVVDLNSLEYLVSSLNKSIRLVFILVPIVLSNTFFQCPH